MTENTNRLESWLHDLQPPHFVHRHLGSNHNEQNELCISLGTPSLESLTQQIIPPAILRETPMDLPEGCTEEQALAELQDVADQNHLASHFIGQGFNPCILPPVILRNILENPGWYTQYTPYQAEIAQGRLEMLLNFQTLITELCGLPFANASLLDEATAVGEALGMAFAQGRQKRKIAVVDADLHPQNLELLRARARSLDIELQIGDVFETELNDQICAVILQTPDTLGRLRLEKLPDLCEKAKALKILTVVAVDPIAQCLLKTPGELGADIVVGSSQRLGLPMGGGGPHAGFMAVTDALKRRMPGRIVGVSIDTRGKHGYRLALQTREQHIRRDKATSNICTAQALPAILSTAYAMYHGPEGLRRIATRIAGYTAALKHNLIQAGKTVLPGNSFDGIVLEIPPEELTPLRERAEYLSMNFRYYPNGQVGIFLNECTELSDLALILTLLEIEEDFQVPPGSPLMQLEDHLRTDHFLSQEAFGKYHTEHEMLRHLAKLQSRDLSLAHSMISLGSCTMKLNATAEMIPVTWPEFGNIHPAAPNAQLKGYEKLCEDLEAWLSEITMLPGCSLQPNAGSQGELAGLMAIREFHMSNGEPQRTVCLIPTSAHGTNPASAVMAGFSVVPVACDAQGNVDPADLQKKIETTGDKLGALMITYPSTHGVFEEGVVDVCKAVHDAGGQVYMDGANMNAQVGLTAPGLIGADVCHLNLHKTFCIPHGGGGPGMGPICVGEHLRPHLPSNPMETSDRPLAISSAPMGSASILVISWMYIRMMGPDGLKKATQLALLNANYMAKQLELSYPVLYTGRNGRVAHEFILDLRELTSRAGLLIDDVAKRLIDYGFHAPTMSFPVPGTLMIEPTESESREELDRFCEAMIAIRREIQEVIEGKYAPEDSPLHHAPHTADDLSGDWTRKYSREEAVFPLSWVRDRKFWPACNRIDNTYGDRNLICTCEWPD
ncbi:aminomethyl-transferring glycine dehydrogenase [Kiritimatiellaeota bacterium B1221]|nr:aminomethyl-transferring glycine dehydrogenase [Kiritimatiellaeota bacterium B1221]